MTASGAGVSCLNQNCCHLRMQVVLKTREKDLDLLDRRCSRRRSPDVIGLHTFTAGKSVGNFRQQIRSEAGKQPANRMHGCVRSNVMRALLRKKINVKRVNC
jgi:hypothetical protein